MSAEREDAPHGLEDKLRQRGTQGRAQRSLASLRAAWCFRAVEGPASLPELVAIQPKDRRTYWRHVSGKGEAAVYELEREEVAPH